MKTHSMTLNILFIGALALILSLSLVPATAFADFQLEYQGRRFGGGREGGSRGAASGESHFRPAGLRPFVFEGERFIARLRRFEPVQFHGKPRADSLVGAGVRLGGPVG